MAKCNQLTSLPFKGLILFDVATFSENTENIRKKLTVNSLLYFDGSLSQVCFNLATQRWLRPPMIANNVLKLFACWQCSTQQAANRAAFTNSCVCVNASNVTGCHRRPKHNLWAGYRAPSLKWMGWLPSAISKNGCRMLRCVFIVEYGIMHFLCTVSVFKVQAPSSYHRLLCAKFPFLCGLHCWARPRRKIAYSITQLFDAPETEACTSE